MASNPQLEIVFVAGFRMKTDACLRQQKTPYGCFQKYGKTLKSSILIGFSILNHPFWGIYPYFWKHP